MAEPRFPGLLKRPGAGLRSRLLGFLSLAIVLPSLLTGLLVFFSVHGSLMKATQREQRALARRLAERVAGHVESAKRGLLTLSTQGRLRAAKPAEQMAALRELLANYPDFMEVVLFNAEGRGQVRAARRGDKLYWGLDRSNRAAREEFLQAAEGRTYVGPVFFTARDRIPQMFVAVPAARDQGVLLARLSLGSVWEVVTETMDPSIQPAVVDLQGQLIAHADRARVLAHENWATRPHLRAFLAGEGPDFAGPFEWGDGGDRRLAVFQRVPNLSWGVVVEAPVDVATAPVRRLGRRVAVGALLLGTLFWFMGLSFIRRILGPLGDLEEGLQHIGRGNLSHRIDIETGDEIQRVAEALNAMASSLQESEKVKRDLIHMIVHDLKNPLAGVMGSIDYVTMVAKGNLTPEQMKLLNLGAKSGRELLRLIQNLLDLAKMEEGRLELKREPFSLLELAGQCVDDLEAAIVKEQKMISVEVNKSLPKAWADRDLVHRVLSNLLSNALKHTPPGTEISIHVRVAEDGLAHVISVRDTGEGIPEEFLSRMFEKFSQAEGKKQNYRVGSGLGLTFCKMAVEAHGGRIWAESRPGQGSEFFFSLPLGAPAAPAPEPPALVSAAV